jgi:hypothetical protein
VAAAACVDGAETEAWETGAAVPDIDAVVKVAEALDVSPEWLAFGAERGGPSEAAGSPRVTVKVVRFVDHESVDEFGSHEIDAALAERLGLGAASRPIAAEVRTRAFVSEFLPGDHLIVDGAIREIEDDGFYLFWTGTAAQLVEVSFPPGDFGGGAVRHSEKEPWVPFRLDHVLVLGKVRGAIGRAA